MLTVNLVGRQLLLQQEPVSLCHTAFRQKDIEEVVQDLSKTNMVH